MTKHSCAQMIRNGNDRDSLISVEQQQRPNCFWPVIVQEIVVPVTFHQFRNQHRDIPFVVRGLLLHRIFNDGLDDEALGRIKDD